MLAGDRILEHGIEIRFAALLGIGGDVLTVEALVKARRHEAWQLAHHRLGRMVEKIDQLLLPRRIDRESFGSRAWPL